MVSSQWKYCAGMVGSLRSTQSLMLQSFCSAPDAIMARRGLQATASTASQCPLPSASLLSLPGILWTICRMPWQYQLLLRSRGGFHTTRAEGCGLAAAAVACAGGHGLQALHSVASQGSAPQHQACHDGRMQETQRTWRPLRCQMQMEWSSDPLMSHLPFLSVTLKLEKTQCFSFTWPAQKGNTVMAAQQARTAPFTCVKYPTMSSVQVLLFLRGPEPYAGTTREKGLCPSAAYVLPM